MVRRGIERIRRRDGAGSDDGGSDASEGGAQGEGEGEGGEGSRRGGKLKGKERAVEVVRDGDEEMSTQIAMSAKKHKAKKAKKVGLSSFLFLWFRKAIVSATTFTHVCLGNLEP